MIVIILIFYWKKWRFFNLIDSKFKDLTYKLLPFNILHQVFFYRRGSRTAGKCKYCARFFADSVKMGSKIDDYFKICESDLDVCPIKNLMCHVKTNTVTLNLYYGFFKYSRNENFVEIFKKVASSSFGLFVIFLQVYFRVYFNQLKRISELTEDNYLSEKHHVVIVEKERLKIRQTLTEHYCITGKKI